MEEQFRCPHGWYVRRAEIDIDTIEDVARAYGIAWLVLDAKDSVPAAAPILAGNRPSWVGPPLSTGIAGLMVYPLELGS